MQKTQNEIVDKIIQEIVELRLGQVKPENIKSTNSIVSDLGIDSLDYASLLFACEEWLGLKVNENSVNWAQISTIDDLATLLFNTQK